MLRFFLGIALAAVTFAPPRDGEATQAEAINSELAKVASGIEKKGEDQQLLYTVLLVNSGQLEKAAAFYKQIAKTSQSVFIPMAIAQGYLAKNDTARAAGWFVTAGTNAQASHPIQAQAAYTAGLAFKKKFERDTALGSFYEAIKHDPTFAPAYYELGTLTPEKDEAIAAYAKTLALVPTDSEMAKKALTGLLKTLALPKK